MIKLRLYGPLQRTRLDSHGASKVASTASAGGPPFVDTRFATHLLPLTLS